MENITIAKIGLDNAEEKGAKEPIFVTLSQFNNAKYLDIRKYYQDNNEWKPTKKGVTMNLAQLNEFVDVISKNQDDINKWFS